MTRLHWHPQPILQGDNDIKRRKTAEGRYPGWSYELVRSPIVPGGPLVWRCFFHDDTVLARNIHSDGVATLLETGTYHQVSRAAQRHHDHLGTW